MTPRLQRAAAAAAAGPVPAVIWRALMIATASARYAGPIPSASIGQATRIGRCSSCAGMGLKPALDGPPCPGSPRANQAVTDLRPVADSGSCSGPRPPAPPDPDLLALPVCGALAFWSTAWPAARFGSELCRPQILRQSPLSAGVCWKQSESRASTAIEQESYSDRLATEPGLPQPIPLLISSAGRSCGINRAFQQLPAAEAQR